MAGSIHDQPPVCRSQRAVAELERIRAAERGREPLFSEPVAWDEVGRDGTDDDGGLVSPPTTSDDSEDSDDDDPALTEEQELQQAIQASLASGRRDGVACTTSTNTAD